MEALQILESFDRESEREAFASLSSWIREIALGKREYERDGEHVLEVLAIRFPTKPLRSAVSLALVLAEMRVDMALEESEGRDATSDRRKIELVEQLLAREIERL